MRRNIILVHDFALLKGSLWDRHPSPDGGPSGQAALTYTPSPMKFLSEILKRPPNEKATMLIPVGYPAEDCRVPDLQRKTLEEVAVVYEDKEGAKAKLVI